MLSTPYVPLGATSTSTRSPPAVRRFPKRSTAFTENTSTLPTTAFCIFSPRRTVEGGSKRPGVTCSMRGQPETHWPLMVGMTEYVPATVIWPRKLCVPATGDALSTSVDTGPAASTSTTSLPVHVVALPWRSRGSIRTPTCSPASTTSSDVSVNALAVSAETITAVLHEWCGGPGRTCACASILPSEGCMVTSAPSACTCRGASPALATCSMYGPAFSAMRRSSHTPSPTSTASHLTGPLPEATATVKEPSFAATRLPNLSARCTRSTPGSPASHPSMPKVLIMQ
mmetsp:Transcript_6597/g.23281  ORF Transcript_6597/g.23281 Transcript_6597/m.23281 type:complete len:285 (-) Transcript_6597:4330-5184(-)